jgi:hypothetical protein
MPPERTAPDELIGLEEKPAQRYQKATPPPSAKSNSAWARKFLHAA